MNQEDKPTASTPASQRSRKKWPLVVGVLAVIIIAGGAGFWVWHESPTFCNAVCHQPMDYYVDDYYNEPAHMAYTHQTFNVACLDCHEPKLDEQIGEALVWVSGEYTVDEQGKLATVGVRSDVDMCAGSGCHDFEQVVNATQDWGGVAGVNPHDSHQGYALDCSSCHTAHGQSVMYCNTCHDFEVPEGWMAPTQSMPIGLAQ